VQRRVADYSHVQKGLDPTGQSYATLHVQRGRTTRQGTLCATRDINILPLAVVVLVDVTGHKHPRATCQAPGTACNYPSLCYKGVVQPPIHTKLF
jgi:hypothetical protein